MRDPIENISKLQKQLNDLQLENQILKKLLDQAGVSYKHELLHIKDSNELMDYDSDQGKRIVQPTQITEDMANNFFARFWGRRDVYTIDGESVYQSYYKCVDDCNKYMISTMIIHLPNDKYPITELGLERLKRIISNAEEKKIKIAFENLNNIHNLEVVLQAFQTKNVGFCYDSCHHKNYAESTDLLKMYGNRLMALHLQDNGGMHNQHQLPFDGSVNWNYVISKIKLTGYKGATTIEPMNWDYENLSMEEFLEYAFKSAEKLNQMREL